MFNVHAVFDFTYLYFKYKFTYASGRLKRLCCPVDWKGSVIEKDVTVIYHVLRDIEKERKFLESKGCKVTTSICFDTVSKRKEQSSEYKGVGRQKLSPEELEDIELIEQILAKAGHNTYKVEGYEADDLVNYLVNKYKDKFSKTFIYTPDKDLAVNISDRVSLLRYKASCGNTLVNVGNYQKYFSDEFGCNIPYNSICLFLSTVGDKSDNVKGINKFGPKAFDKLVNNLSNAGVQWELCGDEQYFESVLDKCKEFLTEKQYKEMMCSYDLVKPLKLDEGIEIAEPIKECTIELRQRAYGEFMFNSLIP